MTDPHTPAPDLPAGVSRSPAPARTVAEAVREAAPDCGRRRRSAGVRGCGERGDYAVFIAVIAAALLVLGGLAYDGPRLIASRQDAAHAANEAARVAAVTIASGGTIQQAQAAAQNRVDQTPLIYGENIDVASIECVGTRVQVTVVTGYRYRSAIGAARARQPIAAIGAAEAVLLLPDGQPSTLHHLAECPLH